MLEQLLDEREVMRSVFKSSFNSPLNRVYNLKEIVANGEPQTWQKLADELTNPLQRYIKQEYGKEMEISPVVPRTDTIFECIKTLPVFMFYPPGNIWGIRIGKLDKGWSKFTAIYSDILRIPSVFKYNRKHPNNTVSYFGLTKEVNNALNTEGDELINIQVIPDYHMFVYTVAHEVGHTLGKSLKVKRKDNENFASTFGLRFMEQYISRKLSSSLS